MKKLTLLPSALLAGLMIAAAPLGAQKVSELDAVVRSLTGALLAGKPIDSVQVLLMKEKDMDELFRVTRAAPPPVLGFCKRLRAASRSGQTGAQLKRGVERTKKNWERMRAEVLKFKGKLKYSRIRGFRVESDCGVRFYRLNLEGRLEKDGVKGKLRLRGMRILYFKGRFKVVRLFRLRIPADKRPEIKPKGAPGSKSPPRRPPAERKAREATRGLIG